MTLHADLTGADIHEPKGADTAALGDILVADGAGGSAWSANQVDFVGVACSDSTTQTAPAVATKKAITLDTNELIQGITHTVSSEDFTIILPGFYNLVCVPQIVTGGGGAGQVEISWEVDTGAGFNTVPGSPVIVAFTATDEGVPVCNVWVQLSAGDIVRSMWATDSASVNIQPVTSLVGDTIPSVQQYVTQHGA